MNALLDRRVAIRTQYSIHARLIPRALGLEPLKDVLLDAKGDRSLGRLRLKAAPNNAAHRVADLRFRMVRGGFAGSARLELGPVSP